MSVCENGKGYYRNAIFLQEAAGAEYDAGSVAVGYTGTVTGTNFARWLAEDNPLAGGKWLHANANAPDTLYDTIYSTDRRFNTLYKAADPWLKAEMRESVLAAAKDAERFYDSGMTVGTGAGGKVELPARPIGVYVLHERNRKGEPNVHVHRLKSRAGVTLDGSRTGRLRDTRNIIRGDLYAQQIFQVSLAWNLQQRARLETDLVNGKCVIPGVPPGVAQQTGTRGQDARAWCAAQGWTKDGKKLSPAQLALAVNATAGKRTEFDRDAAYTRWKSEADRAAPGMDKKAKMAPGRQPNTWLRDCLDAYLVKPWQVIWEGIKAPYRKDPQAIRIQNIDVFLYEVSKRPVIEGHRAALREVRWGTFSSINEALKAAEVAYKKARRPKVHLERNAKVVVAYTAAPTPEQIVKLAKLAERRGWAVEYEPHPRDQQQQQRWQQQPGQRVTMQQGMS